METTGAVSDLEAAIIKANIKEKYHFIQKLANGGFGLVYLAEDRHSLEKFAIKAIQRKKVEDFQTFITEINILRMLDHPNIIKLYEIWEWNNVCFLVLEYCEGGELFQYIVDNKYLNEDVAAFVMK
jgi:calcium-dependent protein kinase